MSEKDKQGHHGHHHGHHHGPGTGHKFDISKLDRLRDPERLEWMKPDAVWDVLCPQPPAAVVDLGVGIGFFAIPVARRHPGATIYGADLHADMLKYLKAAIEQEGVDNIVPVQTEEVAVPLADGLADALLMANLHHELDYRDRSLAECHRLLKPGGRIGIIDWKPVDTEHGPPTHVRIPEATVRAELEAAGFSEIAEHDLLPYHYFFSAAK